MSARCAGVPVSWWRLERYHLGELDEAEREAVAAHLSGCDACAGLLADIERDDAVALPPLAPPAGSRGGVARRRLGGLIAGAGVLAMAAAMALGVGSAWRGAGPAGAGSGGAVKGGDVAFTLVRQDGERVEGSTGAFRDGDAFKALVTCPPSMREAFDLVVFDDGGASFPLATAGGLTCGNEIPLPGALRLTGHSEETVCLVWAAAGTLDRRAMAAGPGALGSGSACKRLAPGGR